MTTDIKETDGVVNASLLAVFRITVAEANRLTNATASAIELLSVDYIKASLATGLDVRDQRATLAAGKAAAAAAAKAAGEEGVTVEDVLPDLLPSNSQYWAKWLAMLPLVAGMSALSLRAQLALARKSAGTPAGTVTTSTTVAAVRTAIAAKKPRKVSEKIAPVDGKPVAPGTRAPKSLPSLDEWLGQFEAIIGALPVGYVPDSATKTALAGVARKLAALNAIRKAA